MLHDSLTVTNLLKSNKKEFLNLSCGISVQGDLA